MRESASESIAHTETHTPRPGAPTTGTKVARELRLGSSIVARRACGMSSSSCCGMSWLRTGRAHRRLLGQDHDGGGETTNAGEKGGTHTCTGNVCCSTAPPQRVQSRPGHQHVRYCIGLPGCNMGLGREQRSRGTRGPQSASGLLMCAADGGFHSPRADSHASGPPPGHVRSTTCLGRVAREHVERHRRGM